VAHRIQEETAKLSGVVSLGHLDGDQYAVLLSGDEAAEAGVVERTARNILAAIASPLVADGQSLVLAASAGAALFPEHAMEGGDLLIRAERAMYRAKEAGGARLALGGEPEDKLREQLRLEYELRQAAEEGAFVLHYQPVLDVEQGCISSVEALIRWPHPERGLVPPAEFVPVLQRLGLMEAVTAWVIDEACRQVRAWQQEGLALSVAVNVPPKMAEAGSLVHLANAAVVRHELEPSALEFEITETAAIERLDLALAGLDALVAAGFRLAIDDFGVGHSSLARLRELPASKMKIDRSLVARVDTDPDSLAILRGLVELGRATGMCVLAEGVETLGEFETVVLSGVSLVQGYAISRPVPAPDVPGLVSNRPARRRAA
jgi:predicted signal transduction protein with EAL and GGDEF domain